MGEFLDGSEEITKHGGDLPHWQQGEVMQFVTFRLADSMPQSKVREWSEQRKVWYGRHPKPWSVEEEREYYHRFTWKLEGWLDEGMGSCLLKIGAHRRILEEVLMRFHGERLEHHSWVIMPNHVHLLFASEVPLEVLVKAWKGVSARRIGSGGLWQKNYRDTLIRDSAHFANAVRYIRKNPSKLPPDSYTLWEGPRALAVA